jgi:dnd system-associated protein 4
MELKNTFGRNMNITREVRKIYDDLQDGFVFQDLDAKYIFMYCLALGYSKKLPRKEIKRYPLLNVSSFSNEDVWLMAAIALEETKNISILGNPNEIKKIAEEYAMAGLSELQLLSEEYGLGDSFLLLIEKEGRKGLKIKKD